MDERRKSIFRRIDTYRSSGDEHEGVASTTVTPTPSSSKVKVGAVDKKRKAAPPAKLSHADNIRRRMEQWRKIEEEALRMEQTASEDELESAEVSKFSETTLSRESPIPQVTTG